jgi:predicted DNA-binding protein YlxM (UPF0122 family)
MINNIEWSKEMLLDLYGYKFKDNLSLKEISEKLNKSKGAISIKLKRVDWDEFIIDPENYLSGNKAAKKWTQAEMGLLFAYMEEGKSYNVIAERIGRGRISVERKAQTTDWKAWKAAVGDVNPLAENPQTDSEALIAQLVDALVVLSRRESERLNNIKETEFRRKVNFEVDPLPISFSEIKKQADSVLESLGLKNPEEISMGEGTYVIVGDSHGKFTKTEMFELLHNVNKELKPKRIIHLGHLIDDDNDISYNWGKFNNLTIVSKVEELHMVQDQRNKFNFSYDIVRGCVVLGNDLVVMNQDLISDYVKTPISSLDAEIFDKKAIVNCHRLELFPKCSEENEVAYVASPGALCEKHIVRTIKQIDFEESKTIKQANWTGFSKYRRMKHMCKYWKQGMLVVHVDKNGNHTIIPCLIQSLRKGVATSYFDKIISSTGVHKPTKKIFITADSHSPNHDCNVLDVQEQIVKDYKPDVYVNMGDSADNRTLNHHIMDRGGVIFGDVVEDAASTHKVLKRQSTWAKECHIHHGNHERFAMDFVEKYPQLKELLNFDFLCDVKDLGYGIIGLKKTLKIDNTTFIHGDMKLFGQTGSKLEKVSKTFGTCVFMGDSHYPAMRFDTIVIGLTGELDQKYNEPSASTWINGFGLCNHYDGKSWPTTIAIVSNECRINDKKYIPKSPGNWKLKGYTAKITFETE